MIEGVREIKFEEKTDPKKNFSGFFSQEFFRSSLVQWILIGTIFLLVVGWSLLAIFIRPIDLPIVLHYNVYLGVDIVGEWWQVYFLPIIADVFFLVNTFLAYVFYQKKERLAAYIFLLASFFVGAGTLISLASLIMINS